jgi:hypothetical protein
MLQAMVAIAVLMMADAAWSQCKTDAQGDCITALAPGQAITPDSRASIGQGYDKTSRIPRCVDPKKEADAYAQRQGSQADSFIPQKEPVLHARPKN